MFDEGEEFMNRRLPILANIHGSTPNLQPVNNIGFTLDMEERQTVTLVRSIIGA